MGEHSQKTDIDWRLDDLAQEHAVRILVKVMSRRNYAGETLVQLVEALRAMEQQAHTTRQDVAKRLADERDRKARDAKKLAERKKAAGK
jgi:DNA topoisomerase VI subunit B